MKLKIRVSIEKKFKKYVIASTMTIIKGYIIPETKNVKVLIEFDLR